MTPPNLELTQAILDRCGAGWEMVTPVADRKGHDRRYSLDDSAIRALGYASHTRFADSLTTTVRWYAEHRDWWEPLKRSSAAPGRPGEHGGRGEPVTAVSGQLL